MDRQETTMNKTLMLGLAMLMSGCYSADFVQTSTYGAQARSKESVQVLTQPPAAKFHEVGIITASGAGFTGALERAKAQAGSHGCDALVVLSEAVEAGRNTPGSAFGMTRNHLRCSCLIHAPQAAAE
jgi:hypothetical protein